MISSITRNLHRPQLLSGLRSTESLRTTDVGSFPQNDDDDTYMLQLKNDVRFTLHVIGVTIFHTRFCDTCSIDTDDCIK